MKDQLIISKYKCDRCGRTNFINGHALGGHKKYCGKPEYKHTQDNKKRKREKDKKDKNHKNKKRKKKSDKQSKILIELDQEITKKNISDQNSTIFIDVDSDIIKNNNISDQENEFSFEVYSEFVKDNSINETLEYKIDDEFYLGLARDPDIHEFNFDDSFLFNDNFLPLTVL